MYKTTFLALTPCLWWCPKSHVSFHFIPQLLPSAFSLAPAPRGGVKAAPQSPTIVQDCDAAPSLAAFPQQELGKGTLGAQVSADTPGTSPSSDKCKTLPG